jgi:hypothetical protein
MTEHDDVLHHGIVVTWPKTRPLHSYLREVRHAKERGHNCYFRVPKNAAPMIAYGAPVYHVHDGQIRGSLPYLGTQLVEEGVVQDPLTGEYWPAGNYFVRSPEWTHLVAPYDERDKWKLAGFRGWRYFDLAPEYV